MHVELSADAYYTPASARAALGRVENPLTKGGSPYLLSAAVTPTAGTPLLTHCVPPTTRRLPTNRQSQLICNPDGCVTTSFGKSAMHLSVWVHMSHDGCQEVDMAERSTALLPPRRCTFGHSPSRCVAHGDVLCE